MTVVINPWLALPTLIKAAFSEKNACKNGTIPALPERLVEIEAWAKRMLQELAFIEKLLNNPDETIRRNNAILSNKRRVEAANAYAGDVNMMLEYREESLQHVAALQKQLQLLLGPIQ